MYHRRFPRILGVDVKFRTNNEKRPLLRVVAKTYSRRNLPILNCYLPSEQEWVFQYVISEVFPTLLDNNALKRTSLIITDQDQQEMNAIGNEIGKEHSIFGTGTKHRLCKWHKVRRDCYICLLLLYNDMLTDFIALQINRNYENEAKSYSSPVNKETDTQFISTVKVWLMSFTNSIETEWEENDSLQKLIQFCSSFGSSMPVSPSVIEFTERFIRKSFIPKRGLISQHSYMHSFSGWVADNCFTESENSTLARDACGPAPNNGVDISIDRIISHTNRRYRSIMTSASNAMHGTMIYRPDENTMEQLCRILSKDLVKEAVNKIMAEYDQSTSE